MLILASASPRRLALLKQIQIVPDRVIAPDIDESSLKNELPRDYVKRVALAKAHAIFAHHPHASVLAADTIVACGRQILPKAEDEQTARACLKMLSARRHNVMTSVVLLRPESVCQQKTVTTQVRFKPLTGKEIDAYIASHEWQGKAGGYGIQGIAESFITLMQGSYSNVVGLPLYETAQMLNSK